jgi:hypothetical protein
MKTPKLFVKLPDYVSTPDGMAIDSKGDLILSCPNFADLSMPGLVMKIDKNKNMTKLFEVPVHPETGCARPMGIALDAHDHMYICDNQAWPGDPARQFKCRILRVEFDGKRITKCVTVANRMEHPNGIKIRGNYMYVTESKMTKIKHPSGLLVSGVYRFALDDENIDVENTLDDPNLLTTYVSLNADYQYGTDGLAISASGDLYVGVFGDGAVYKTTFNEDASVKETVLFAKNPEELKSTDGMTFDDAGNLYIADFNVNAIVRVTPDGTVSRFAQSPDCDGFDGGLDQPGEPCIWGDKIIVSCFDLITGREDTFNTQHELPATLSELPLN